MYSQYANKWMWLETGREQSCKTDICLSGYLFLPGFRVKAEGTFKIKWWMKNPNSNLFSARRDKQIIDRNNTELSEQLTHDPRDLEYPLLQTAFPEFSRSHPVSARCSLCGLAGGSSWSRSCAQRGTCGHRLLLCSPAMGDEQHFWNFPANGTNTTYNLLILALKI